MLEEPAAQKEFDRELRLPIVTSAAKIRGLPAHCLLYQVGIETGVEQGRIVYAGRPADDRHGHLGSGALTPLNCRPLAPEALPFLKALRKQHQPTLLELGPGAGLALSKMSRLLPGALIDGAALTPISPYWRFATDKLPKLARDTLRTIAPDRLEACGTQEPCLTSIADLEAYLLAGGELLEADSEGFFHRQYIGRFPNETLPPGGYDFVYDACGAFFYAWLAAKGAAEPQAAAAASAAALLNDAGALLTAFTRPDVEQLYAALRPATAHGALLVQLLNEWGERGGLLLLKEANPLFEHFIRMPSRVPGSADVVLARQQDLAAC